MKKISLSFLVFSVAAVSCYAQEEILAQGKITDSRTSKGIKANVRYSSIPTGSIFGRFSDSTFSFPIFGQPETVEGFSSKTKDGLSFYIS